MGSFDKYSNHKENAGVSSVIFGLDKPVLEVELNEAQELQKLNTRKVVSNFIKDGISDPSKITFNATSHTLTIGKDCAVTVGGYVVTISNGTTITPTTFPCSIYIQIWEESVSYTDSLKEEGYTNSTTTVSNWFKDSRVPVETTRRKVVKYTLSTSQDSNKKCLLLGSIDSTGKIFTLNHNAVSHHVDKDIHITYGEKPKFDFISNTNLLGNWYFLNTINTKGKTSYSTNGVTIDLWEATFNNNGSLTVGSDYITLQSTSSNVVSLKQKFVKNSVLSGCEYSFSIVYSDNTMDSSSFYLSETPISIGFSKFTLSCSTSYCSIDIKANTTVSIKAIKLERGSSQTLVANIDGKRYLTEIPNYYDILHRCLTTPTEYGGLGISIKDLYETVNKDSGYISSLVENKANKSIVSAETLLASKWKNKSYSFEDKYPQSNYDLKITLHGSASATQISAWNDAVCVSDMSNILTAKGTSPTVDIPIILEVVEK